jgi:hypothetical protein
LTAGVVRLRRGSKKSENAVLGRKMLFLDGHYLKHAVSGYIPLRAGDRPLKLTDPVSEESNPVTKHNHLLTILNLS